MKLGIKQPSLNGLNLGFFVITNKRKKFVNQLSFAIVINEDIFNELPDDMKRMAIDECLAGVTVSDSDALGYEKPDFNTYSGVLKKYGDTPTLAMHESIKSLYDVQKQKETEEKAAKKGKRGKKNTVA
jgi:hypothetical protein